MIADYCWSPLDADRVGVSVNLYEAKSVKVSWKCWCNESLAWLVSISMNYISLVQWQTKICPILSKFPFKAISDMSLYTTHDGITHFCYTRHFNTNIGVVITSYVLLFWMCYQYLDETGYVSAYCKVLKVCSHKTVETLLFLLSYSVLVAAFFFNVHFIS